MKKKYKNLRKVAEAINRMLNAAREADRYIQEDLSRERKKQGSTGEGAGDEH